MNAKHLVVGMLVIFITAAIPPLVASFSVGEGQTRTFAIKARQYAYDPPRITVNKGDEVHIRLVSLDVVHGFYLEGYDIDARVEPGVRHFKLRHPSEGKTFTDVNEIVFTADRPGKFRYRCSHTCGTMHPFMQGELIVQPNYPYLAGAGGVAGVLIVACLMMFVNGKRDASTAPEKDN